MVPFKFVSASVRISVGFHERLHVKFLSGFIEGFVRVANQVQQGYLMPKRVAESLSQKHAYKSKGKLLAATQHL